MLERLAVRSLGIIEEVEVELSSGFTVLTGETGAGKSLLVESLELLAGARASAELVRTGDGRLRVDGWFAAPSGPEFEGLLEEFGLEQDQELVIRREVTASGRSRCWVNDVAVTAGTLRRLAPSLLAIHGQHDQFGLADSAVQRRLVDQYGDLGAEVDRVAEAWRLWAEAATALKQLQDARAHRRDRLDAISFQLAEIEGLNPEPGEDEQLRNLRRRLRHAVRLQELSAEVLGALGDNEHAVVGELARAERAVAEMEQCGLEIGEASEQLKEARVIVEEVLREISENEKDCVEDPRELEDVEGRLHRLEQLMLKYGHSIDQVLEHRDSLVQERSELGDVEDRLEKAREATEEGLKNYDRCAQKLHRRRVKSAEKLVAEISAVLANLEMAGTRLDFRWAPLNDPTSPLKRGGKPVAFAAEGVEEAELMLAANPGEELRPMAKIASGGELSRLHLALRSALRRRGSQAHLTLLFDEVDSGLGGRAASALGVLLADLATRDQVLVVTHLAQVAGRAGAQLEVKKVVQEGRTVTQILPLVGEARVLEVARMLAGENLSEAAQTHARELLESPRKP
ncbi:MAG: DNA repair protein RecN [Thermoanaerobaculales bacterium]|nr:DNA repair protein RecN [Thermoanaerobaculales bacterium]